jgi:hypothetical protein
MRVSKLPSWFSVASADEVSWCRLMNISCVGYFGTPLGTPTSSGRMIDRWMMMNWNIFGRKRPLPNRGTKKVKLSPWRHMGEWRYSSTIFDHGTRWRWVVTFTPRPLYLRAKSPQYPLDRRLGGSRRSGRCEEEKISTLPRIEPRPSSPPSTLPEFVWRYWIKLGKPSVSITGVPAEIRAKNLPNI